MQAFIGETCKRSANPDLLVRTSLSSWITRPQSNPTSIDTAQVQSHEIASIDSRKCGEEAREQ